MTPGMDPILRVTSVQYLLAALGRVAQHPRICRNDRQAAGREADVSFLRRRQASHQETCGNEQHDRHRHLADDENVASRPTPAAGAAAATYRP